MSDSVSSCLATKLAATHAELLEQHLHAGYILHAFHRLLCNLSSFLRASVISAEMGVSDALFRIISFVLTARISITKELDMTYYSVTAIVTPE